MKPKRLLGTHTNQSSDMTPDIPLSEDNLWHRFIQGDDRAFDLLYHQYANQLMAYGMGWGFDRETLKDAIQDVFYKLFVNRKAFKAVDKPKAYLLRALKNRILDLEKREVETTNLEEQVGFSVVPSVLDQLITKEEQQEIEQQIVRYLNLLTGRQREAVYLRYIEGLDYEEIALILELTVPAARKLICRAIARIRLEELSLLLWLALLNRAMQ